MNLFESRACIILRLAALSVLFALSACYEMDYPLGGADTALRDHAILGAWRKSDDGVARPAALEVAELESGELAIRYVDPVHGEISTTGMIHDLNGVRYLTARGTDLGTGRPSYGLFSYALESGKLKLLVVKATLPEFSSQEALRAYLTQHADRPELLFEGPMYFERSGSQG